LIARTWRGWVSTERAAAYIEYVTRTGLSSYKKTPGNLGAQLWTRDLGDGRTEVMTVSWWSSRTDIEALAGQDIGVAVFYAEDDDYLVDRETTVTHYDVAQPVLHLPAMFRRPARRDPGGGAAPIACTSGWDVPVKGATRGLLAEVRENRSGSPSCAVAHSPAWNEVRDRQ
jgi:heme-degrading monooxygenase HmoA